MPAPQYSAGTVTPVRDAAPGQQIALGQATQQAGEVAYKTGATIGDRLADMVDDYTVRNALTGALSDTNKILNDPQDGYLHKLGHDAVDGYQAANAAVVKTFKDPLDNLANPIQKQMYTQAMNGHLLSFGKEMFEHNFEQTRGVAIGAAKASADSYLLLAQQNADSRGRLDADGNSTGPFATYINQMHTEVLKAAALNGLNADDAQTVGMLRDQDSQLNKAIILGKLDHHDLQGAQKIYDEERQKLNLTPKDEDELGRFLKGESDKQAGEDGTQRYAIKAITGGDLPVTLQQPMAGGMVNFSGQTPEDKGLNYTAPANTNVMATSDGKVAQLWKDDKNGLSVQVLYPNGSSAILSGFSATQVQPGDNVRSGETLGVSGGDKIHYTMQDAKGNFVDPRSASQPQPDMSAMADPDNWKNAVDAAQNGPEVPQIKKRIIAGLDAMHGYQSAIANQEYEQKLQGATDTYFKNGGYVPPSQLAGLRPEDVYKLQQPLPTKDNVEAQEDFILHPENQTVDWVQKHKLDFTNGTFLSYLQKAQNNDNSPDKEKNASLDATQMDNILYQNHMGNLVNPAKGSADAITAVGLKSRIMDLYTSEQNTTKQPLTRDRKAEIIGQAITDQVSVHGMLWDSNNVPVVGLTDSQAKNAYVTVGTQRVKLAAIPAQDQLQITAALRRTGQQVTQQKIAEYWVKAHNGKVPTF